MKDLVLVWYLLQRRGVRSSSLTQKTRCDHVGRWSLWFTRLSHKYCLSLCWTPIILFCRETTKQIKEKVKLLLITLLENTHYSVTDTEGVKLPQLNSSVLLNPIRAYSKMCYKTVSHCLIERVFLFTEFSYEEWPVLAQTWWSLYWQSANLLLTMKIVTSCVGFPLFPLLLHKLTSDSVLRYRGSMCKINSCFWPGRVFKGPQRDIISQSVSTRSHTCCPVASIVWMISTKNIIPSPVVW